MANAANAFNALLNFVLDEKVESADALMHLWREGNFDAIRAEWPEAPEAIYDQTPDPEETLLENVQALLEKCPFTVRDLSGDLTGIRGKESLTGSLVITFLGMQNRLKEAGITR